MAATRTPLLLCLLCSCAPASALAAALGARAAAKYAIGFKRDKVCFVPGLLDPAAFAIVAADCRSLRGKMKRERDSIALGRLGHILDSRSDAYRIMTSPDVTERINRLVGSEAGAQLEASDFPIELRHYPAGSGMEWHRDDQLYDDAQCELVLTLENDSDSETEWFDASGEHHAAWTPPNSALLVRAGDDGARHRVRPIKRGERTILKQVWALPGSPRRPSFFAHIDSFPGLRARQRPKADGGRLPRDGEWVRRRGKKPAR